MASLSYTKWMLQSLLLSSFLLLLPSPTNAQASNLLIYACNVEEYKDWNATNCVETLQSNPRIASAPNLQTLAAAIIEEGLSNATTSRESIQVKANDALDPALKSVIDGCLIWYTDVIEKLNCALAITKENDYESASDHLQMAGHSINYCDNQLVNNGAQDLSILTANKFVMMFCATADQVITRLGEQIQSPSPSPYPSS